MKSINHSGFKFGWKNLTAKPTIVSDGFYSMREWQERAFDELKMSNRMILNAPMGSGKSWLMCLLSAFKMKANPSLRCILTVPQTIIANGFAEANLLMPDGEKLHWIAQHDLCNERTSEGTINYVIKWLEGPYGFFGDRVLLCTHNTIRSVYKNLKETNRLDLLNNLFLWIDEAHHLQNSNIEGFEDSVVSNNIGELVAYAMDKPDIQLGLATASFFRGDRLSLLTDAMETKFTRFNLPYDEYLESMEHLQSFSFDFLLCGHDYTKAIENLAKVRTGKDIIYIPHPKSKHSTGDKYEEVENIISKYKKIHGGRLSESDTGLTSLCHKDGEFKIIDLVDENLRSEKKDYIGGIKDQRDALDVIVALGMFKEGANWIWADRSIIVGARSSLVDVIQMIGRLFRDAKGKKHVEVIQLLPFSLDQQNEEDFKENLNNYLKAIYASLILENILHPVQIKFKEEKNDDKLPNESGNHAQDWLGEVLPDDSKQLSLIEEISNSLLQILNSDKNVILWDEYQKILPEILEDFGITEHIDEVGKQIWAMFARQSLRMQGIAVEDIEFDVLQKTSPLDFMLRYTSGNCGIDTFQKLREAIGSQKTLSEWVSFAEKLAEKHGGVLPCQSWLKNNGLAGLETAIRQNRELFSHIIQEVRKTKYREIMTLEEHVIFAEQLAKEHGGKLPSSGWIQKQKLFGLSDAMYNYPESFAHLEQEKIRIDVDQCVIEAEMLEKQYGKLPIDSWLRANGYRRIGRAIANYPDKFEHIKKDTNGRSNLEIHLKTASSLIEANNGKMPTPKWLKENGHESLMQSMSYNPDAFSHIEKSYEEKGSVKMAAETRRKHVKDAEELARKNGGVLPAGIWLRDNGYNNLRFAVDKYPDSFAHIKQEYRGGKSIDEHVKDAEYLVKNNNGRLPKVSWLMKNNYNSLAQMLYKYPNKFIHLKREKRGCEA